MMVVLLMQAGNYMSFRRGSVGVEGNDVPDGQITYFPVHPPSQKYSASRLPQITSKTPAIPSHTEGRFAIVT